MEKLQRKHILPYLDSELQVLDCLNQKVTVIGVKDQTYFIENGNRYAYADIQDCKPILRPLSEFTDINSESMNELNADLNIQMELNKLALKFKHCTSCSYSTMQLCFENHIDVFGLIEKGLAVDINTLQQ